MGTPLVASVCPNLQGLRRRHGAKLDDEFIMEWPQLRSLDLESLSISNALLRAIESVHLATLHRITLKDIPSLHRITLKDIHWDRWLTLNVAQQGPHPYPLRELEVPLPMLTAHWAALKGGWVRDVIEYTPRLETLRCDEILDERRSFQQRKNNDDSDSNAPPALAWIRGIHIRMEEYATPVSLNDYAFELLTQASVVEVAQVRFCDELLGRLSALPQLTMLHVREDFNDQPGDEFVVRQHSLASVSRIPALHFECRGLTRVMRCPWHLRGATQLRVLEIWYAQQLVVDGTGRWADSLVCLEEVRLECYRGSNVKPLARLVRLRVAEIPKDRCNDLRDAIEQGELQQLAHIYHGKEDCMRFAYCGVYHWKNTLW